MLDGIKVLIEMAASLMVIFSLKVKADLWLSVAIGVSILIIGIFNASSRNARSVFQVGSAILILLPWVGVQPIALLWMPVGVIMFAIAAAGLIKVLMI